MKAYCITLDRHSTERALAAIKQIQRLGFEVEFADGVNVKDMNLDDIAPLLSTRAYFELKFGREVHEALSGLGSVGCYFAHLNLWRRCAAGTEPIAIFEDDVDFQNTSAESLPLILQEAEENKFDILRLIYNPQIRGTQISSSLSQVERGTGTSAYLITPQAARVVAQNALPIEMHCDHFLDFCPRSRS